MNTPIFRALVAAIALAAGSSAAAQKPGAEAAYPAKSIRMIVPFTPGGGTDIIARLVAQDLNQSMKSGRMRALAVSGAQRSSAAPEVPTVAESGVPGYAFDVWYGMLFPARTPRAILDKANAGINGVLKAPALAQRFAGVGLDPSGSTPEEFARMIRSEMAKWRKVVASAGIRIE